MSGHRIASREEWLTARKALLAREKELTRMRDAVAAARRELPWVPIATDYRFDGADGSVGLGELFEGRRQLVVYHFMLGPGWKDPCPSCSFWAEQFDGNAVHLRQRNTSLAAVSRAPYPEIAAAQRRMGWKFRWVSSHGNSFNADFGVGFEPGAKDRGAQYNYAPLAWEGTEMPGLSVFAKDESGAIFHTYSCYARGLDTLNGTYQLLDLTPKGRDEAGLPWPMAWVKHKDRYGT
jgi:predicted dithiol-disulfide oxidoreductase (DUF899 family)